jgi:hypothetical protein
MDQVINLILGSKKHAHHEGPSAELVWLRVVEVTKELKVRRILYLVVHMSSLSRVPIGYDCILSLHTTAPYRCITLAYTHTRKNGLHSYTLILELLWGCVVLMILVF